MFQSRVPRLKTSTWSFICLSDCSGGRRVCPAEVTASRRRCELSPGKRRNIMPFKVRDHHLASPPGPRHHPVSGGHHTPVRQTQDFSANGFSQDPRQQPGTVNTPANISAELNWFLQILFIQAGHGQEALCSLVQWAVLEDQLTPVTKCWWWNVTTLTTRRHETRVSWRRIMTPDTAHMCPLSPLTLSLWDTWYSDTPPALGRSLSFL